MSLTHIATIPDKETADTIIIYVKKKLLITNVLFTEVLVFETTVHVFLKRVYMQYIYISPPILRHHSFHNLDGNICFAGRNVIITIQ